MSKDKGIQLAFILATGIVRYLFPDLINSEVRFIVIFFNIIAVFVLPGTYVAQLLLKRWKRQFSWWEFVNIASVSSLLIIPLIFLVENAILGRIYAWLPYVNAAILCLVAPLTKIKKQHQVFQTMPWRTVWFWSFLVFTGLILYIALAYKALPELDPYYWLDQYRNAINENSSLLDRSRPLFYALNYIFIGASGVDSYAYFKYVLPFLSILTLIPAGLVASRYSNRLIQVLIFAMPLFSPSTFLYSQIPFPQAIVTTIIYYFFFWQIYALQTQQKLFYYLGGILVCISYGYHESAVIIILIWLLVTIYTYKSKIVTYIKNNKLSALIIATLAILDLPTLREPILFVWRWIFYIVKKSIHGGNVYFPASYLNIDGHEVGWAGFLGVSKYYLYYVGPVFLALMAICLVLWIKKPKYRSSVWQLIEKHPEAKVIVVSFITFFTISEILPRFANVALLPERSWAFGGIFLSASILHLLSFAPKKQRLITSVLLICTGISLAAALYINNLKKYVVPSYQLNSAAWIQKNLPLDRIMVTSDYALLLKFHSISHTIPINRELYCDERLANPNTLLSIIIPDTQQPDNRKAETIEAAKKIVGDYLSISTKPSLEEISSLLKPHLATLEASSTSYAQSENPLKNKIYIYYATSDINNPYLNRPYIEGQGCKKPIFALHPEAYQPIYNDDGKVIIWSIK